MNMGAPHSTVAAGEATETTYLPSGGQFRARGFDSVEARYADKVSHPGKFPYWLRLAIIVGLSSMLWGGIISAGVALS